MNDETVDYREYKAEVTDLENQIIALEKENASLKSELHALKVDYKNAEELALDFKRISEEKEKENAELTQRVSVLERSESELKEVVNQLIADLEHEDEVIAENRKEIYRHLIEGGEDEKELGGGERG